MSDKLKIALVAAFVVVNAVLLVVLSQTMSGWRTNLSDDAPAPTELSVTPTPTAEKPEEPKVGGNRGVALADDGTIIRWLSGSCEKDQVPELKASTNGGDSFDTIKLPEASAVLAVRADSGEEFSVVTANKDCVVSTNRTSNGGKDWESAEGANLWRLAGRGEGVVISPNGEVDAGCTALSVSPISEQNARVLCDSGEIRGTDDTGETWISMGTYPGATAGVFPSIGEAFVVAKDTDCEARVFRSGDGGGTWNPLGCAGDESAKAFASNGDTFAAIVGKDVAVSTDGGTTWGKA